MKTIINDRFMLHGKTAEKLYQSVKALPIIDYHCHISPKLIAEDHKFKDLTELMLGGDHYKWRAMRSYGIDEEYITGSGDSRTKWRLFSEMLTHAIGNPLYHWTHLELERVFGIEKCLTGDNADEIFDRCTRLLQNDEYSVRNIIRRFNVETICTTDDPCDSLEWHKKIKKDGFEVGVFPAFRPDKAVNIDKDTFVPYISATGCKDLKELCEFMSRRIDYFDENGCKVSDHGLDYIPYTDGDADAAFSKALNGDVITKQEADAYKTYMLRFFGREYCKRGWVMQIHVGALRNNNSRMFAKLGPDTGYDSINDLHTAEPLSRLMDSLDRELALPKTILYSLNPNDNYTFGTMIGNFQSSEAKGKIQLGSGWWFNDQRDGMEAQLKALSNLGVLGTFVGMLTDSRSFVSYTRHEYFRRILCNLIGSWVDRGEYPRDIKTLTKIVSDISYNNASEYFGFYSGKNGES